MHVNYFVRKKNINDDDDIREKYIVHIIEKNKIN
jgi:hypothetical protein